MDVAQNDNVSDLMKQIPGGGASVTAVTTRKEKADTNSAHLSPGLPAELIGRTSLLLYLLSPLTVLPQLLEHNATHALVPFCEAALPYAVSTVLRRHFSDVGLRSFLLVSTAHLMAPTYMAPGLVMKRATTLASTSTEQSEEQEQRRQEQPDQTTRQEQGKKVLFRRRRTVRGDASGEHRRARCDG